MGVEPYAYSERTSTSNSAIMRKMTARRRSFTLCEKLAAVRVAEGTNNCEAARRFSVLIVNNIGSQLMTEDDLYPRFDGTHSIVGIYKQNRWTETS